MVDDDDDVVDVDELCLSRLAAGVLEEQLRSTSCRTGL